MPLRPALIGGGLILVVLLNIAIHRLGPDSLLSGSADSGVEKHALASFTTAHRYDISLPSVRQVLSKADALLLLYRTVIDQVRQLQDSIKSLSGAVKVQEGLMDAKGLKEGASSRGKDALRLKHDVDAIKKEFSMVKKSEGFHKLRTHKPSTAEQKLLDEQVVPQSSRNSPHPAPFPDEAANALHRLSLRSRPGIFCPRPRKSRIRGSKSVYRLPRLTRRMQRF